MTKYFTQDFTTLPSGSAGKSLKDSIDRYNHNCEQANRYVDSLRAQGITNEIALEDAYYAYMLKLSLEQEVA